MAYIKIKKMPPIDEIIAKHPISDDILSKVAQDRKEICEIISGKDPRLMLIIGPCSAWPSEAVLEYAKLLAKLSEEVKDKIKIVMRLYTQKPRTIRGWLGPINQPSPFVEPDIPKGLEYCREMMVKVVSVGLPIADEALFTGNARGFEELLSWIAIGARSVEDQEHRIFASRLDCAVGMKNSTSGLLEPAVHACVSAAHPHDCVVDGFQVRTNGNKFVHLVLRGGQNKTNYDLATVQTAEVHLIKHSVPNHAVIIDASHDNCKVDGIKYPLEQSVVVKKCLELRKFDHTYRTLVKGFMVESFIKQGSQKLESCNAETVDLGGLSITDPCIGWEETEDLIKHIAFEY